jgi:hypothetical protein
VGYSRFTSFQRTITFDSALLPSTSEEKTMVTKKAPPAKRPESPADAGEVDVNAVLQSAIKAGLIKGETTVAEVAAMTKNTKAGTLGYALAWDRYVAVVK